MQVVTATQHLLPWIALLVSGLSRAEARLDSFNPRRFAPAGTASTGVRIAVAVFEHTPHPHRHRGLSPSERKHRGVGPICVVFDRLSDGG